MHSNQKVDDCRGFGRNDMNHGPLPTWSPLSMLGAFSQPNMGFAVQPDMTNRGSGLSINMPAAGNYYRTRNDYQQQFNQQNHLGQTDRSQYQSKKKLCRNGQKCDIQGCGFHHTPIHKQCRNGNDCANKETTCLFSHASKNE